MYLRRFELDIDDVDVGLWKLEAFDEGPLIQSVPIFIVVWVNNLAMYSRLLFSH